MSKPDRKILLVSWSIPPGMTGSSIIVGNLAKQFSRDEMVVLGAYYMGSPPLEWKSDLPRLIHATLQPPDGWRGARWLRWAQSPWLFLRTLVALKQENCDLILAVYPDETFLLAAYLVSRVTRTPLYAYFHNTLVEKHRNDALARWLQARVFSHARLLFVISPGMRKLYQRLYPTLECTCLPHSFNEELPDEDAVTADGLQDENTLRLALSGSINKTNVSAAENIARAVQEMPDVFLTLYTGTATKYLHRLGFYGEKFDITTVSRDVLLQHLRKADIVVLPHGFSGAISSEEIETIFPTRTIEYLLCGRPILAHLPGDCFLAEFLREHDCALLVTEQDVESVKQALLRLKADASLRKRLVRNALRAAHQFQAAVVADDLRNTLREK